MMTAGRCWSWRLDRTCCYHFGRRRESHDVISEFSRSAHDAHLFSREVQNVRPTNTFGTRLAWSICKSDKTLDSFIAQSELTITLTYWFLDPCQLNFQPRACGISVDIFWATLCIVIYKTRHLKYDTNYKQYESRSYILSEFSDPTWSFIRHGKHWDNWSI
jgi:hypothetical protein